MRRVGAGEDDTPAAVRNLDAWGQDGAYKTAEQSRPPISMASVATKTATRTSSAIQESTRLPRTIQSQIMPSIILPTNSVRRPASRLVVVGSSRKKVERALSRGGGGDLHADDDSELAPLVRTELLRNKRHLPRLPPRPLAQRRAAPTSSGHRMGGGVGVTERVVRMN